LTSFQKKEKNIFSKKEKNIFSKKEKEKENVHVIDLS